MHHTITAVEQHTSGSEDEGSVVPKQGSSGAAELPGIPAQPPASSCVTGSAARSRHGKDLPARWLAVSMVALGALSASAAVVSFAAQYRMVRGVKGSELVSALEAAIPDVAALIFATLGIALALHGRRAIRARILNLAAVSTSVGMNVLAAGHGWRNLAIWVMPPIAYALASDTAIGVVRAWTLARARALEETLADDAATPLALLGGLVLWLLRLILAPVSTLRGFRAWVIEECPVAPGRRVSRAAAQPAAAAAARNPQPTSKTRTARPAAPAPRPGTKTQRFLDLVTERHGPLAEFPLADVSRVSSGLSPQVDLNPGAARSALRRHVQAARAAQPPQTAPNAGSDEKRSTP